MENETEVIEQIQNYLIEEFRKNKTPPDVAVRALLNFIVMSFVNSNTAEKDFDQVLVFLKGKFLIIKRLEELKILYDKKIKE